jgi:hypothetical protein
MRLKAPYGRFQRILHRFSGVSRIHNRGARPAILTALTLMIAGLLAPATARAITADQANLINEGFNLFTTETFDGNGRTCGTCHIPQDDYNISPADLATLSAHDTALVFGGSNANLENQTLIQKLTLFNINDETPGQPGTGNNPTGPFRTSMSIGGLAFTTVNQFKNEPPHQAIDDGTRLIEIGWAGDGSPVDPALFEVGNPSDYADCVDEVNDFNNHRDDLTIALNAFSLGAIRHHLTASLNRVPGVDFRCPTPEELNALSVFQEYLGRQFELALSENSQADPAESVITFRDKTAETGKAIFLDARASCTACHFNAGANDTIGAIKLNPQPIGAPSIPFGSPITLNGKTVFEGETIPVPGANKNSHTNTDLLLDALNAITSPVVIPSDPGDGDLAGAPLQPKRGAFNVQSIIEAPRKKQFFHNGAFTTRVEDAASFYFTPAFDNSQSGHFAVDVAIRAAATPVPGCTTPEALGGTCGPKSLASLATSYFGDSSQTQNVLATLGFFLRALSTVYSIADCERLVQDSIDLVNMGMPINVQVLNCTTNLNDVSRVIGGARVKVPGRYKALQNQAASLVRALQQAAAKNNAGRLRGILGELHGMRQSIATITPDLPY